MKKHIEPLTEQIINFQTAKLAKEKGLTEGGLTWMFYEENGRVFNNEYEVGEQDYICCTQEFLRKWLREQHNIDVWAKPFLVLSNKKYLGFVNFSPNKSEKKSHITQNTYEEAIEFALVEALKLIK